MKPRNPQAIRSIRTARLPIGSAGGFTYAEQKLAGLDGGFDVVVVVLAVRFVSLTVEEVVLVVVGGVVTSE